MNLCNMLLVTDTLPLAASSQRELTFACQAYIHTVGHLQSLANVSLRVVRFCTFRADEKLSPAPRGTQR